MELKTEIQQCLQVFSGKDFRTAAIGLLNTLGYQSEKTLDLDGSPDAFLEQFDNNPDRAFRKDKFYYDQQDHFFINDKAFIMTSDSELLPYLTAVLNSSLFRCCFKDNFPNLGEDRRELRKIFVSKIPIKGSDAATITLFETLVDYIQFAKADTKQSTSSDTSAAVIATFLEKVIDACVMEVYFAEHMRERNLDLMEHVRPMLPSAFDQHSETEQWQAVTTFFEQANATDHPIRNRLTRIISDSPELLAVIKKEGKV